MFFRTPQLAVNFSTLSEMPQSRPLEIASAAYPKFDHCWEPGILAALQINVSFKALKSSLGFLALLTGIVSARDENTLLKIYEYFALLLIKEHSLKSNLSRADFHTFDVLK